MRIQARIPRRSCEVLVGSIRNVLRATLCQKGLHIEGVKTRGQGAATYCKCLWVAVFLAETKVNDVDHVEFLANAHQKVVGFNVAMEEIFRVHVLYPTQHLIREHQHCLEAELAIAEVEQVCANHQHSL